jgi:hypothetical protein
LAALRSSRLVPQRQVLLVDEAEAVAVEGGHALARGSARKTIYCRLGHEAHRLRKCFRYTTVARQLTAQSEVRILFAVLLFFLRSKLDPPG